MTGNASVALLTAAVLGSAALLALHLAGAWLAPSRLWGLAALRFVPGVVQGALVALAVLCLAPPFARRLAAGASSAWSWVESPRGRTGFSRTLILSAAAFVLFVLLRSHNYFLGDGYFRIEEIARGKVDFRNAGSLDLAVHYGAWRVLQAVGAKDPAMPYWLVSALAGSIWVALLPSLSRRLIPEPTFRWVVPAFLLTLGSVQLFFGYVECYTLRELAILAYFLLALRALAGASPLPATGMLTLAGGLHLSALALAPSLIPLYLRHRPPPRKGPPTSAASFDRRRLLGGMALAGIVVAAGAAVAFRVMGHYGGRQALLPLRAGPGQIYGLFAPLHLLDVANLLLLVAPGTIVLLVLGLLATRGNRLPRAESPSSRGRVAQLLRPMPLFWILASLGPLGLVFVLDPKLGNPDWDLLAIPAVPATLAALSLLWGRSPDRGPARARRNSIAAVVLGVSILHVVPWVLTNHSFTRSAAMVRTMVDQDPHYRLGTIPRFYSMGRLYYDHGLVEDAFHLMNRALAERPHDDWVQYWVRLTLGKMYAEQGRLEDALKSLQDAAAINPHMADVNNQLGTVLGKLGRYDEALQALLRAKALEPTNGEIRWNLGYMYHEARRYGEGNRELEEAFALLPPTAEVHWQLAWGYRNLRDWPRARDQAERAIRLDPSHLRARMVLSEACFHLGDQPRALEELRTIIRLGPDTALGKQAREVLQSLEQVPAGEGRSP